MTINFAFLSLDAIINMRQIHYMFDGQFNVPPDPRRVRLGSATATHSRAEPIFAHFPGLYVGMPSTPADAKGMLKAAIRDDNPVLFTESIALYGKPGPVPDDPEFVLPIGKSDIKREGDDVTIVTIARGVSGRSSGAGTRQSASM
jgi:pyruvate dehydrogenase E1 component beta subunit